MSFSSKLVKIREERGFSQAYLAKKSKISRNTIINYEDGSRTPTIEMLAKIAEALGVDMTYFFDSERSIGIKEFMDIIAIPVLSPEVTACCGTGIPSMDITSAATETVPILKSALGTYIDDMRPPFAISTDGDSMAAWGIPNGSKVVINPAENVNNMDIALVCYWGKLAIKRVKKTKDEGVELLSADGQAIKVSKDEIEDGAFSVWGKAMVEISKIKHAM